LFTPKSINIVIKTRITLMAPANLGWKFSVNAAAISRGKTLYPLLKVAAVPNAPKPVARLKLEALTIDGFNVGKMTWK
jgi:hypothetical protein